MRYESHVILRDVFFRLSAGDRVGLIGKNGSGKTTLFKLILGQEEPTEGTVAINDGLEIGYFSQFSELKGESTVLDVLDQVFAPIRAIEAALEEVGRAMELSPGEGELDRLVDQQAGLFEEMDRLDGWDCGVRIETVLSRLGFSDEHRVRPMDQLSGGWRNRAALAKILLEDPPILLMDEPTNFLDLAGLTWLEEWFGKLRGALLLVSHDRHFLDQVVDRVIEIENHQLQEYEGGFTGYVHGKQRRLKTLERQFEHEEALLAHEAHAIDVRKRSADKTLKRRMANIKKRKTPRPVEGIITSVYQGMQTPNVVCTATGVSKQYDDQQILLDVGFELRKRERLAILGPNGCGKTTLLRILTGQEEADAGAVKWGIRNNLEFAYYNQILEELDPNDTVTHAVNTAHMALEAPRKVVNRFLTLMQFSEMDLKQRLGTLSGGQRARVALAKCLLSGAPVIILDEPTNHLDVTSTQVMELALVHFPGSVLVVSHDRFFIDKVATRLLVFEGGGQTRVMNGNW
ncbi:MAG: ATPase subunit of ABC transporter with duplicated ATPase domains, partial [Myxococcota bacterium]